MLREGRARPFVIAGKNGCEQAKFRRNRQNGIRLQHVHVGVDQSVASHMRGARAKARFTAREDAEQAVLQHIEVHDSRQGPDGSGRCRCTPIITLQHEANPEAPAVSRAIADHVEVARLEDAQGDFPAWKQDRGQRKQRQRGHRCNP